MARYPERMVVQIDPESSYGDCLGTGYKCDDLAAIFGVNVQTIKAFKRTKRVHKGFAAALKLLIERDEMFARYSECVEKSRLMKADIQFEKALVPKTSVTDLQRKILEKINGQQEEADNH
jgi:hypothetical protein